MLKQVYGESLQLNSLEHYFSLAYWKPVGRGEGDRPSIAGLRDSMTTKLTWTSTTSQETREESGGSCERFDELGSLLHTFHWPGFGHIAIPICKET